MYVNLTTYYIEMYIYTYVHVYTYSELGYVIYLKCYILHKILLDSYHYLMHVHIFC